ncbi:MAG: SLC13 family permease [Lachnospira sp.]
MKKVLLFLKKETVLTAAWILAVISAFFVVPDKQYMEYIDWRSLGILWGLMVIMKGLQNNGVFEKTGIALLSRTKKVWQLCAVLIFLCFFCSMLITNDVALITFVPFAIMILKQCGREDIIIPVVVLQTIAANLGSMLTPVGNPQNLYLYGLSGMGMAEFIIWMLPCTLVSFILLVLSMMLIKGKSENVLIKGNKSGHMEISKEKKLSTLRIIIYTSLFIIALLTVARMIPNYVVLVVVVFLMVIIIEPKVIISVDYALLATFVGFFIFTGNMGRIDSISEILGQLVKEREIIVGIIASQCISNVPAALLLSGFTGDIRSLLYGVNIGGLGTLIASMASLISYKLYTNEYNERKGQYFRYFTVVNIVFLIILTLFTIMTKFDCKEWYNMFK